MIWIKLEIMNIPQAGVAGQTFTVLGLALEQYPSSTTPCVTPLTVEMH